MWDGGHSGARAGFLRVLRFPLPILIPPTASHTPSIIRDWYNSQQWLTYQVGSPPQETKLTTLLIISFEIVPYPKIPFPACVSRER
jgi:hypothetical protein